MLRIADDNGLSDLIRSDEAERICTGFDFTEGPVWVPWDDCLLFTDIPQSRIHRWRPGWSEAEVYRAESGFANGLTLDHDGNLLACEHFNRRVSRAPYNGEVSSTIDRFEGKRFNSPNDIIVDSSGAIWFTDPNYGLTMRRMGDFGVPQEIPFQGVYRATPDGMIACVTAEFTNPNGLTLSPDESVLYVGDSHDDIIRRYSVQPDGALAGGDLFVDMREDSRPGVPDGMKVDNDGRLWTTGTGGVWVLDPDGTRLGVLQLPEGPANLCFGGPDFTTLYLTARTSVYQVETRVHGVAPGSR
jgi:sugar lactone lactonase YvrE